MSNISDTRVEATVQITCRVGAHHFGVWLSHFASAVVLMSCTTSAPAIAAVPDKVTFDDHVMPIFREHCLACHDQGGRSGDLALDTYNDALTGGAGGEVVDAGASDSSRLYRLMAHLDKPIMPPGSDKLPDAELAIVEAWIDGGLLENAGSKAKTSNKPKVETFVPSTDNRPTGEPAMPGGFYREPVLHTPHEGAVADVAASPWAPLVAVTGQRQVLLYHADSHELLGVVPFVVGMPEVVRFSRNGDLLLVGGGRGAKLGVVHLWDIKSGERITEVGDELDTILAADITADHALVAIGGPRKRVQVHRTADGSLAYSITKHTDWVTALEFSPNGKHLATADRAGNAHVWEATTGRPVANLTGHKQAITAVAWRGDSGLLITASDDGDFRTWQPGGNQVKQWGNGGGIQDVAFTKSGRLVSIGRDKFAKLWNAEGKEVRRFGPAGDIGLAVAATHDQTQVVFGDWTGIVRVAKLESGELAGELSANPPTLSMQLAIAKQALSQAAADLGPAEAAIAEALSNLKQATQQVSEFNAKQATQTAELAKLEKEQGKQRGALEGHRKALEQLDKAVAAVKSEQQEAETAIVELRQQLASVGNQEGDDADAETAGRLEMRIADQQSALEDVLARRAEEEGKRPHIAQSRKASRQRLQEIGKQLTKHKQSFQELAKSKAQLPNIEILAVAHQQQQARLDELLSNKTRAEQQIASLTAELEAYAAAVPKLQSTLVVKGEEAKAMAAELEEVKEQLATEATDVATVVREMDDLKQRIADLERVRKKLSEVADATQQSASEMEQRLAELSNLREKIEKAVADFHAAAELRKLHPQGD